MNEQWVDVGTLADIPRCGARVVKTPCGDIAVFRSADDKVFALRDRCPHRGGPLSQGIVHGEAVTCPLHNWVIGLGDGEAQGADHGCARRYRVELRGERVLLHAEALAADAA